MMRGPSRRGRSWAPSRGKHVEHLPEPKGNALAFCLPALGNCSSCWRSPEALHARLGGPRPTRRLSARAATCRTRSHLERFAAAACLPFDRALGTAMAYAFMDVRNVVGHAEMASRIFEAAPARSVMPARPHLPAAFVTQFKALMFGLNLTQDLSSVFEAAAVVRGRRAAAPPSRTVNATDAIARRADKPPGADSRLERATGAARKDAREPREQLVAHAYYDAMGSSSTPCRARTRHPVHGRGAIHVRLRGRPSATKATKRHEGSRSSARGPTQLATRACAHFGASWVMNPWDDRLPRYDIAQRALPFLIAALIYNVIQPARRARRSTSSARRGARTSLAQPPGERGARRQAGGVKRAGATAREEARPPQWNPKPTWTHASVAAWWANASAVVGGSSRIPRLRISRLVRRAAFAPAVPRVLAKPERVHSVERLVTQSTVYVMSLLRAHLVLLRPRRHPCCVLRR